MHILVSAGPTHEAIDPVRYLANRSSGKMGFAFAAAAANRGWEVTLVAGPVAIPTPPGVRRIDVVSAAEMYDAVACHAPGCDIAILAAAVADFTPALVSSEKIKKSQQPSGNFSLNLVPTRDILASMRHPIGFHGLLVGFAAESSDLLQNARLKLKDKHCDHLLANDISIPGLGFGSEENALLLLSAKHPLTHSFGPAQKSTLATQILQYLVPG